MLNFEINIIIQATSVFTVFNLISCQYYPQIPESIYLDLHNSESTFRHSYKVFHKNKRGNAFSCLNAVIPE